MKPPKEINLTVPVFALAVGTRAMLGAGLALLLADKLERETRRATGWTLTVVGAVSTLPIAMQVFGCGAAKEVEPGPAAA